MTFAKTFRKGDAVCLVDDPSVRGFVVRYGIDGRTIVVEWDETARPASVDRARIKHAPVEVIGVVQNLSHRRTHCPACENELTFDKVERFGPGETTGRIVWAVFCGFCEFVEEVR